ncbi:hypothetical protein [Ruminococcus flavefaciens]|uniref:hypothetical protein n=1 Tax=Ruminococcus flavefaciens TaxID=1265 RepID=UPI0013D955B9|nr:hypothetical protein [Ruminococcus flavefaciens]
MDYFSPEVAKALHESLFPTKDVKYTTIEEYVLQTLGVTQTPSIEPEVFQRNFIYLMCNIIKDIKEIEDRLKTYRKEFDSLKSDKGLDTEYKRRKLKYFCEINKQAHKEICSFISDGLAKYLLDKSYDMLKREDEREGQFDIYSSLRYKYALHRKFFSYDYPFDAASKIEVYLRSKYELIDRPYEEMRLMDLLTKDPDAFWKKLYQYVDDDNIMDIIKETVENNYHLSKRKEIFETLNDLLSSLKYQSFITLGLIQIEGLFDDYCRLKFGENNTQGTLIEKVKKSLENNEFAFYRMYPYFALDIPKLRNEVAHTGMIQTEDTKKMVYNLILDLNTLAQMVIKESDFKFRTAQLIYEKISEFDFDSDDPKIVDNAYDRLLHEMLYYFEFPYDDFWNMIKNPNDYIDEIQFYKIKDLEEGYIDIPGIINSISEIVRSVGFWKAIHRLVKDNCKETSWWIEAEEFAKKMKNDYISILDQDAKAECIEVSRILDQLSKSKKSVKV